MTITPNSLAAGNFGSVKNENFAVTASVLARKVVLIASKDAAKTGLTVDVPVQIFSSEDCGDKGGFGSMAQRLAKRLFEGSQGVETWLIPQDEAGGAAASAGELDWTGSTGVVAGTIAVYIAGDRYPVNISAAATIEEISDAVVAVINAVKDAPVVAATTAVTFETTITAKSKGPWGDDIDISLNLQEDDATPAGVLVAITDMTGGSGVPDITSALDAMGTTGTDSQNEKFFTDFMHGYGQDTTTLDAISAYNGAGNDFTGNYKKEVHRPFRGLSGDTTADTAGLSALIAIGDGRKLDRTQSIFPAPGSQNHPEELAAFVVGTAARKNNSRAESSTIDDPMPGFRVGDSSDRWTDDDVNRNLAIAAGICTSQVKNGVLTIQNLVTFYHPDSVPVESNGYRQYRNISLVAQNILTNVLANFGTEKWHDIVIVDDKTAVSDPAVAEKARDVGDVIDDLINLANIFEGKGWLFTASYTIEQLQEAGAVSIRAGITGFDSIFKVIPSGEGGIFNTEIKFDTSIAILLQ